MKPNPSHSPCRFEMLEPRLLLVIPGGRPAPDPTDEAILFRLPLATDTTTHFYFDRNGSAAGDIAWDGSGNSYDGHTGTDYSGGPRGKPVYAAAGGVIVAKVDGFGDQQGTANGNYIKLNHGNDRNGTPINTWYLHLNAGSLTTKAIGDYLAPGEFVGGVGTSGNSTGLHLHLHVAYGSQAFDPYAASGETTWWFNQGVPPSTTPAPNKFAIGDSVEVFALASGDTITVRGPNPTSPSIGSKPNGAIATILEGPVLSATDGNINNNLYNRYKARFTDGLEGWVAQNWLRKYTATQDIQLQYSGGVIIDGAATPISFGSVEQGAAGPTMVFSVRNVGTNPLSLGTLSVPAGYTVTEGLGSNVNPGAFDTFTVRLDSATQGTKPGQISLVSNDPDENPFNFAITGTVTGDVTAPTADVINVSPDPHDGPLSSMTIVFSEAVIGFDKSDLTFARNGMTIALTADQALESSDNITFTLTNLGPLTQASGTYGLMVGTGVTDVAGNALAASASDVFKIQTPLFRGDAPSVRDDSYSLRRSLDGNSVEVFDNIPFGATPSYTLPWAGLASLTFDAGAGNNTITIDYGRGNPIPAGASGFAFLATGGNNTLNLNGGGDFTFFTDAAATTSNLSLNINGASVTFNTSQRLAALAIEGGGASLPGGGKTLLTKTLSIVRGGIDLNQNAIAIDYTSASVIGDWLGNRYDGITGLLATGRADGAWTGPDGIFSSAAGDSGRFTLGVGEAANVLSIEGEQTSAWRDQTVDASCLLVKFTYAGDTNLDGELSGDDYFPLDANVLNSGVVFGYATGDINFDGLINGDDYFALDSNILSAGPPL